MVELHIPQANSCRMFRKTWALSDVPLLITACFILVVTLVPVRLRWGHGKRSPALVNCPLEDLQERARSLKDDSTPVWPIPDLPVWKTETKEYPRWRFDELLCPR